MRRSALPMVFAATLFVLAGGFVHLREWFEIYRAVPAGVSGAAVVRVGFPLSAAMSLLSAGALVGSLFVLRRWSTRVLIGSVLLQVGSLATLVQTRVGSVFGWSESTWTLGAKQTLAVEIGALACLAAVAVVAFVQPDRRALVPVRVRSSS